MGGGWAVQCPTEGGTDEVREKWREKNATRVGGREHSSVDVSFLQRRSLKRKQHSHLNYRKSLETKRFKSVHATQAQV